MSSLLVRQPLVEELGVHRRNCTVAAAGDDRHRGLHLREQIAKGRKLGGAGAHVTHRFDEAVALLGRRVVLPDCVGQRVPPDSRLQWPTASDPMVVTLAPGADPLGAWHQQEVRGEPFPLGAQGAAEA